MPQSCHDITTESGGQRILRFLRRRAVELATVLYVLTVIYNSLMPLDLSAVRSKLPATWDYVWGLPVTQVSVSDAASNVVFYVPLGMLLCAMLVRAGWSRWLAIVPTVLFGVGLSYLMELAQLWSPTRVSTVYDCLYNTAGVTAGAVCSRPAVLIARHFAQKFTAELKVRPTPVLTALVGCGLVLAALLPMDITFSTNRLRTAVDSAQLVPFEKLRDTAQTSRWEGETDAFMARHIQLRNWWALALDYATWSVLYAVFALIACYYLRTHCRLGAGQATLHALGCCAVYAVASTTLQLFVISRGFDVTVLVFQIGGAALGTLLQPLVLNRPAGRRTEPAPLGAEHAKPLLALGLTVVMAGIAVREFMPFRFETAAECVAAQIARIEWLPMSAYQTARFHFVVDDLVRKVLRFAVLGALLAAAAGLRQAAGGLRPTAGKKTSAWRTGTCVALAVTVMEAVQILLPSRVPGVTDVLLAWFGSTAGVHTYHLGRLWWYETSPVGDSGVQIDYRVELGEPGDVTAPRERAPRTEPQER